MQRVDLQLAILIPSHSGYLIGPPHVFLNRDHFAPFLSFLVFHAFRRAAAVIGVTANPLRTRALPPRLPLQAAQINGA